MKKVTKSMRVGAPDPALTKSENTRLRILNAAAFILSREGYAGTKLADIADRAKLRISTLYYYFESRDDLVLDVLLTGSAQVRKHIEDAVASIPPDISSLDRVCIDLEAHLRYILEISHYTEAAIRNTNQLPEPMRIEVAREQAKYGRLWQQLIDDAAGTGTYKTANERRALRLLILGALNWTVEWWTPKRASIDEVVETAVIMARRALSDIRHSEQ